ncbi:MAG TPA: N-acetyltransferase [Bacteroidetes bacterium]|nr:N-acetyltransferase [Bacteroidota bacterium]
MAQIIHTSSLKLIACDLKMLKTILNGRAAMAAALSVDVPENWSEFGTQPIQWTHDQLASEPTHLNWLTYLGIHKKDQRLVSTCGYKGKPDAQGIVEIGYEVHPDYRLKGLATEIAQALVGHAFSQPKVKQVIAHTLAKKNESSSVLQKAGFSYYSKIDDPEDGLIWQWRATLRPL